MRIKKLILRAFGHFSDKSFDFGSQQPGKSDFHIIYGRNEAGKTTLMEAWLRLLFGIRKNEKYAFHSYYQRRDLKLAAVLEADGQNYEVIRQPQGHGSVLLDKNGKPAEAWLQPFLRNFSGEGDYRNRLCLDDEVIEKGAQEIIDGKGELGDLLFSSAAGIPVLSQLLEEEKAKAAEIYKGQNKSTRLGELKRQYEEVKEQIDAADMSAGQYQAAKEQFAAAKETEQNYRQQRQRADDKKTRLTRALENYRDLQAQEKEFADKLGEIVEKLAVLGLPENMLQAENSLALYAKLRPFILTSAQIEALRQARAKTAKLVDRQAEISAGLEENEKNYTAGQQALAQLEQNLPPAAEYDTMASALRGYHAGQLKQEYRAAQERIKSTEQRAQAALAELSTVQGEHFTALPAAGLSPHDAERLLQDRRAAKSAYDKASEKEAALLAQQKAIKAELAEMQNKGENL
ncbi:AAA family ATPase [Candidatus Tokpelaia sp.]|uniref:AAA family ATPase n=1 Tax=Candidatus Tokpelaia sp. TaxID=2233777 RepID=UPI001239B9B6|nr:AAA family ATPase [Candidatus Tokpelaia sp.]KAA6404788.1 hypothetical protein DPQ22_07645 [Candidatus Tokpelaia sp.]